MAKPIRRTRVDATQKEIVEAIRKAGCFVWVIGYPADLLVYRVRDKSWHVLECKAALKGGKPKLDKRQLEQGNFISLTGTPYVTSIEQALEVLQK